METKLNIAEILKDKPKGTKLYTDAFGELSIEDIFAEDELGINLSTKDGDDLYFYNDGKYNVHGEPILFPSKEMRDWSKFSWKEGDILVNKDGDAHIIFAGFDDDTYETFNGNNYLWENEGSTMCFGGYEDDLQTSEFNKANKEDAQKYIHKIKKRLGGKLNHETLEIEKTQPEFKDGDIAYADYGNKQAVFIVSGKTNLSEGYNSFIALDLRGLTLSMGYRTCFFKKDLCNLRLATEAEKQQLFDALAKEGKAWDAEKKQIVDLKPKIELKPFDRVLVRDDKEDQWSANIFSYQIRDMYHCLGECYWKYCIPYEGNEYLLGTTKDVEG